MKNFSYKFLQQLNAKKANKGFTLIELLVVIIIIGILSAIALPAFLNQANKARQSEAKQALGAINRGQQAYYLERQLFSDSIDGLALGINTATENYSYGSSSAPADYADGQTAAVRNTTGQNFGTRAGYPGWRSYSAVFAVADTQDAVRDYMGVAYLAGASGDQESTTQSLLCEEADLTANNGVLSFNDGSGSTNSFGAITVTDTVDCGPAGAYVTNGQNVGQ